jgi:hypothetical protein
MLTTADVGGCSVRNGWPAITVGSSAIRIIILVLESVPIDVAKVFELAGGPLASAKGFFSAQVQRQIRSHPR